MPSLYEFVGGEAPLHLLEQTFYDSVLADPLLQPLSPPSPPSRSADRTGSPGSWASPTSSTSTEG